MQVPSEYSWFLRRVVVLCVFVCVRVFVYMYTTVRCTSILCRLHELLVSAPMYRDRNVGADTGRVYVYQNNGVSGHDTVFAWDSLLPSILSPFLPSLFLPYLSPFLPPSSFSPFPSLSLSLAFSFYTMYISVLSFLHYTTAVFCTCTFTMGAVRDSVCFCMQSIYMYLHFVEGEGEVLLSPFIFTFNMTLMSRALWVWWPC